MRSAAPSPVRRLAGFVRDVHGFGRELRAETPDLLVVNVNGSDAATVAGRLVMGRRVLSCYHLSVRRSGYDWQMALVDRLEKVASMWASWRVVHVSRAARDEWCRLCRFPRSRTRVIYNGVDHSRGTRSRDVLGRLGVPDGVCVFCVPGRLHPVKGHEHLIQAIQEDPAAFVGAQVLICGDGPLRADLERRCAAAGLEGIVRFVGWRKDLPQILAASNCTVLPSVESENLSIAALESLASGTPVIATRVGGMAEAVRDGETGYVVAPASAAGLRGAMAKVLGDREQAARMGERGRRDVQNRFDRENMRRAYVDLLANSLTRTGTHAHRDRV